MFNGIDAINVVNIVHLLHTFYKSARSLLFTIVKTWVKPIECHNQITLLDSCSPVSIGVVVTDRGGSSPKGNDNRPSR